MEIHFCECIDCGYHLDYMFILANFRSFRVTDLSVHRFSWPSSSSIFVVFCLSVAFAVIAIFDAREYTLRHRQENKPANRVRKSINDVCEIFKNLMRCITETLSDVIHGNTAADKCERKQMGKKNLIM